MKTNVTIIVAMLAIGSMGCARRNHALSSNSYGSSGGASAPKRELPIVPEHRLVTVTWASNTDGWARFVGKPKNFVFEIEGLAATPLSAHRVRISGRVSRCGYDIANGEHREVQKTKYVKKSVYHEGGRFSERKAGFYQDYVPTPDGVKIEVRKESVRYTPWMPRSVVFDNPFGKKVNAVVGTDGSFSAILDVERKYFLTGRSLAGAVKSKYFKPYHYAKAKSVRVFPGSPPEGVNFPPRSIGLLVNWLKVDLVAVEKYARGRVTYVTLSVCDKATRSPVSPAITVTGSRVASLKELKRAFISEFGDDDVAEKAIALLPGYVKQGEKERKTASSMSFAALVGATYRIETVHKKYYYFSGSIGPVGPSREQKTVLLVEKGAKVRIENVKKGTAGSIVDSD